MEMRIREIQVDDAPQAAILSGQLGYPTDAGAMRLRIQVVLESSREAVWVAEKNAQVVGWLHASRLLHLESGEFAEIVGLVVDENQRGLGIGKLLVEQAKDWAKAQGLQRIVVRSNTKRKDTHRFYLGLGFEERKEQKYFGAEFSEFAE